MTVLTRREFLKFMAAVLAMFGLPIRPDNEAVATDNNDEVYGWSFPLAFPAYLEEPPKKVHLPLISK